MEQEDKRTYIPRKYGKASAQPHGGSGASAPDASWDHPPHSAAQWMHIDREMLRVAVALLTLARHLALPCAFGAYTAENWAALHRQMRTSSRRAP